MKNIQIYDKPMCCSTGVCGPQIDPVLPRFAADLEWLRSQGHQVDRFNLAQQPDAFTKNDTIHKLLASQGTKCLPVIVVDGHVVSQRGYPTRELLSLWTGGAKQDNSLPMTEDTASCCGGKPC
ncbi:MAG TPA: arsenite efflux transporter metallochaperone ArsD [Gemmatales bacterium]|nr:arsenite efflux transporter metallochaperone ArsD [Gemmatales bacterium]